MALASFFLCQCFDRPTILNVNANRSPPAGPLFRAKLEFFACARKNHHFSAVEWASSPFSTSFDHLGRATTVLFLTVWILEDSRKKLARCLPRSSRAVRP